MNREINNTRVLKKLEIIKLVVYKRIQTARYFGLAMQFNMEMK